MTTSNDTTKVADVILEQLGGSRFLAMTGASHLIAGARALHMRLPKNASGANRLTIVLEALAANEDPTYPCECEASA